MRSNIKQLGPFDAHNSMRAGSMGGSGVGEGEGEEGVR